MQIMNLKLYVKYNQNYVKTPKFHKKLQKNLPQLHTTNDKLSQNVSKINNNNKQNSSKNNEK